VVNYYIWGHDYKAIYRENLFAKYIMPKKQAKAQNKNYSVSHNFSTKKEIKVNKNIYIRTC
jgi:hypothetical protein